jgi:regulator of sigma E protease
MSILVAILGLALLILIHEAGHFYTALAVRMRPRSFNIGFGPPLVKVSRRGIDYAVRGIPLGGYVKIPGMHRPAPSDVDVFFGRLLREAPQLVGPAERIKRALGAGDLDEARRELDELERLAKRTHVEGAERGIQELGDALSPDAYWRQRTWKRVAVIFAGPATNLAFAVLLFAIVYMIAGGGATTTVADVLPGKPATEMGLRPGDDILAINGTTVTASEITRTISGSRGRPLSVLVERDGRRVRLGPARARPDEGVYRLGFRLQAEPLGPGEAIKEAVVLTGIVTRETAKSLARLVHKEGRDQISSPVGIVKESSSAARAGWESYLLVLGFISLSLALLNLLPLLPLDGGHIAFSLIEGIRGRALRREIYERVSAVGIAVVLLLFFVGLTNDVGRLGGG